jgi:UDP-N-acetylmuramoyl-tripeptide--D-alanyl-D-alanine ligase
VQECGKWYNQFMVNKLLAFYFAWCARRVLSRATKEKEVIGITGSSGKTSTKEALGLIARAQHSKRVLVSSGNLNNEIGLPLSILGYTQAPPSWHYLLVVFGALWRAFTYRPPSLFVLEYGIDHPGDMDFLLSIVKPTTTVLTSISPVHLEYFDNVEQLVREKLKLAQAISKGMVIINGDDKYLHEACEKNNIRAITFGEKAYCTWRIIEFRVGEKSTSFTVANLQKRYHFSINALGVQHIYSVLPAIIYGHIVGMGASEIQRILSDYTPLPGRGNIVAGRKNTTIINETYNANPLSMEMALKVLAIMKGKPKIAILGDMLELGAESEKEHKAVLDYAHKVADEIVTVGPRMKVVYNNGECAFTDVEGAKNYVAHNLKEGAVILVKGSQGTRMEKIVEAIMLNPSSKEKLLPRQSKRWRSIPIKPL